MNTNIALAAFVVVASAGIAQATVFDLNDRNSHVTIDTNSLGGDRPGMTSWDVDGVNHLWNQWFWFRTGDMTHEDRINALPNLFETAYNGNFPDTRPEKASVVYGYQNGLQIELGISLSGGTAGSNRSDIAEQISIRNEGSTPITMSFFQYCDLDLGGTIDDDTVAMTNPNAVMQADYTTGYTVSETVITPSASNREVGVFAGTLTRLDDGNIDNLDGTTGPLVGRADYTWAFQWTFTLAPGDSYLISKDKSLVPTPGAAALLGLTGLVTLRRRR